MMSVALNLIPFANLLLADIGSAKIWYSLPLVVVISLVYGATRHEYLREILQHAFRSAIWVVGFMFVIFAIIFVSGYWN